MSDSDSELEYEEVGDEGEEEEEEEEEKPKVATIIKGKRVLSAPVSAAPTKEDYLGLMAKANKEPNRFKKRMDIARAKKMKQKVVLQQQFH